MGAEDAGSKEGPSALVPYTGEEVEKARREGHQFKIVRAEHELTDTGHRITIPAETEMATTAAGRRELENGEEGERWAAGGSLVIIRLKNGKAVAVVRQRDQGAPSYPGHWTLGSGLSTLDDDLSNPTALAVREGVEEFIIGTPDGVVVPKFDDPEIDDVAAAAAAGNDAVRQDPNLAHLPPSLTGDKKVAASASFYKPFGEETLEVVHADGSLPPTTQSGTIALDPKTKGVDFLKTIVVDLRDHDLDDLDFLDGETNKKGESLNGVVGCLEVIETVGPDGEPQFFVTNRFVRVDQNGERLDPDGYNCDQMTKPLERMRQSINGSRFEPGTEGWGNEPVKWWQRWG